MVVSANSDRLLQVNYRDEVFVLLVKGSGRLDSLNANFPEQEMKQTAAPTVRA